MSIVQFAHRQRFATRTGARITIATRFADSYTPRRHSADDGLLRSAVDGGRWSRPRVRVHLGQTTQQGAIDDVTRITYRSIENTVYDQSSL
jgi:hypothetical protein